MSCIIYVLLLLLSSASTNTRDNNVYGLCDGHPGIPGTPGRNGHPGMVGRDGRNGRDGMPGIPGQKGDAGSQGVHGPMGEPGVAGPSGPAGEKGVKGDGVITYNSAFSAKRSKSHITPLLNEPVQFDVVIHNDQRHYDPMTGKFSCEIPGLYYFVVHSTVYKTSLQFDIMKNYVSISSFFQYYGNWSKPVSLSGGALMRLDPKDQVWVQVTVGDYNGIYSSAKTDSTFTGFLVYSDWQNAQLLI
ncbi:complement C1q tumor necrosis factor-related protein 5 [Scyliorhinus canicula]|uniref:complement C1q tumor necrosis factor-related protein 5 n=1 Tax=Scyliorhinus canicula TaxID=7830 RepID=UPI0018F61A77|nr:complement C1q tumor necrosis factor-related protein 5 [Scyliorhinus canicula]